jgi:uncharacterized integral membrane protein
MSRLAGILTAVSVVLLSMAFAALNAGNSVTLNLGLFTLYRAPVALVAFGGLFVGMVVMFATGVHTDLKVRGVLRDRLAEESREEQKWIDRNQQDLFEHQPVVEAEDSPPPAAEPELPEPVRPEPGPDGEAPSPLSEEDTDGAEDER